jgi:hypothetical protein
LKANGGRQGGVKHDPAMPRFCGLLGSSLYTALLCAYSFFSDLHLERDPDFRPNIAADTDVIVLAGDIGSYQSGSRLRTDDFGLGRFAPRDAAHRVQYVPGNHEFDALEYEEGYAGLRHTCDRLGITWLEREVVIIAGVSLSVPPCGAISRPWSARKTI